MPSLTCISKFVILAVCCVHFSLCGGRNSRNRLSWLQVGRSPFFNVNGDSTPVGGKGSYKKLLNARRAADIDDGQPGMVKLSELDDYCASLRQTVRFPTRSVNIGKVSIGSNHPIACQTMTTSDTRDVEASVEQVLRCTEAGADIVRLTVQGLKEAEAGIQIKERLLQKGCETPLVADIHFNPRAAMKVCEGFDKIRVNPGNFVDGVKNFNEMVYDTYEAFLGGRKHIESQLVPLIEKLKLLNRAMRIGTNHGSLSSRITSYYGDSSRGMVESALEFAEICRANDFHNFCFSMKSSNPIVMVQAYRLLVASQIKRGWNYPIHLGVTEAGEGEDGRIKSAIGIGSLLQDGIGDTIRVSLTEDPWLELKPCRKFASLGYEKENSHESQLRVPDFRDDREFRSFTKTDAALPELLPGDTWPAEKMLHRDGSVISVIGAEHLKLPSDKLFSDLGCKLSVGMPFKDVATSDSVYVTDLSGMDTRKEATLKRLQQSGVGVLAPIESLRSKPLSGGVSVVSLAEWVDANGISKSMELPQGSRRVAIIIDGRETREQLMAVAASDRRVVNLALLRPHESLGRLQAARRVFHFLSESGSSLPIIHYVTQPMSMDLEEAAMRNSMEIGALFVDGLGHGVMLEGSEGSVEQLRTMSFNILQARPSSACTGFYSPFRDAA
eukprot:GHVN01082769.1.p1 GENE.GHVN01082769.1~~GHVN01082769.1.p1  ORF type:complete len:668 (+),score=52.93 GHVN01082769.1:48-2051(+)